jgi:toxin ParE1/3/4
MKRIIWSDAAIADLQRLRAFLDEAYGPDVSQSAIDALVLAGRFLLEYPGAGVALTHVPWRKWRPRNSYQLVIYKPTRDGIEIVRVRNTREDWRPES